MGRSRHSEPPPAIVGLYKGVGLTLLQQPLNSGITIFHVKALHCQISKFYKRQDCR
jgi:hypothetical protein